MSDTIYRQDAIDAILHNQEVYSNNFGNDPIDKYTIAIIDNDAQTIAQLPSAQPEPQWIPCGERLPEKYGDYLVTTHNGQIARYIFIGESSEEYWRRCATAWMPLPEPYEEKDNERA